MFIMDNKGRLHRPLMKIVNEVGSVTDLADLLKVSRTYVSNWLHNQRPIPATQVKKLVELSNGKVTEKELRPDVF